MRACLLFIALVAGCATSGRPIDQAVVAGFEPGRTTYQDVIQALGAPTSSFIGPGGRRTIAYSHAQVRTNPATFVPVVGLFAGGTDVHSESAAFTFDRAGVLEGASAHGSNTSSRNGF